MERKNVRDIITETTVSADVAEPDTMLGTGTMATRKPDGNFSGCPYFKVDKNTFHSACRNIKFRTNHNWEQHLPKDIAQWIRVNKYRKTFYLNHEDLFFKLPR